MDGPECPICGEATAMHLMLFAGELDVVRLCERCLIDVTPPPATEGEPP